MSICWTIFLGIATSFVASLVFTFFFTRLKPSLTISKVIGHSNNTFKIKVVNNSRFAAINVKAELSFISLFDVPQGSERQTHRIDLLKDELFDIDKFDKKSKYATYTYRFVTKHDIRKELELKSKDYIRFKISAIHSLSNIGKVFQQEYGLDQIVNGDFAFGNIIDIHSQEKNY